MTDFSYVLDEPAFVPILESVDRTISLAAQADIPGLFAEIPTHVFGVLAALRPTRYPNISAWLPAMPPEHVQKQYVGFAGTEAIGRSVEFVDEAVRHFEREGRKIRDARILDYGVGWGRILRLFYKFVPTAQTCGVDVMPKIFEIVQGLGFRSKFILAPALPTGRVCEEDMDLIWAFSVFTHLSERGADHVLAAMRSNLADDGLAIITIRPREFCRSHRPDLLTSYDTRGFAFVSQAGDYGDTAMSLEFFKKRWPQWRVEHVSWDQANYMQIKLYLRKA